MESSQAIPDALGRHLSLTAAREHGVSAGQLPKIGTDPEIFGAFYAEHLEELQRFVARRVDDAERAADLTSDIFLAAIGSAHRYRSRATPKTWLYGIAVVVIAEDRRRGARERARGERLRARIDLNVDDTARIDERIDAEAHGRRIYEAMDRLGNDERAVLELVAIDELTVVEAATALGIRPVTARVRLHRARRKVRINFDQATVNRSNADKGERK